MPIERNVKLAALFAKQHGVVHRRQVHAVGLSDSSIRHRIQSGVWDTLLPGVYSLAGLQIQWRQRLMAAVLSSGNLAAVSHRAAPNLQSAL